MKMIFLVLTLILVVQAGEPEWFFNYEGGTPYDEPANNTYYHERWTTAFNANLLTSSQYNEDYCIVYGIKVLIWKMDTNTPWSEIIFAPEVYDAEIDSNQWVYTISTTPDYTEPMRSVHDIDPTIPDDQQSAYVTIMFEDPYISYRSTTPPYKSQINFSVGICKGASYSSFTVIVCNIDGSSARISSFHSGISPVNWVNAVNSNNKNTNIALHVLVDLYPEQGLESVTWAGIKANSSF